MQALHVVALVERVDDGLPVRVDDRRAIAAEPHALEAIRREEGRERFEELQQWLGVRVEIHEDEPAEALGAAPVRRATSSGRSVKSCAVGNVHEAPVERVRHPWYGHRMHASSKAPAPRRVASRGGGTCCGTPGSRRRRRVRSSIAFVADRVLDVRRRAPRVPPRGTRPARPATTGRSNSSVARSATVGVARRLGRACRRRRTPHAVRAPSCQNRW